MSGRAKRSGPKPKAAADHVLRGTFREDRHGALVTATAPTSAPAPAFTRKQVQRMVVGLGTEGRKFVRQAVAEYTEWGQVDLSVLYQAARVLDRVSALDNAIADDVVLTTRQQRQRANPLLAERRAELRTFTALIRQLDLKLED